ncbi:hypothetical protein IW261DRAFT_1478865 [Armillaria novae-zelandiae]|uniref:Secreted protein n=1 Tax=Armillaria novae-zelandiae TaxID=153914 RepID=A0AA39P8U3_9AGAR|nr:hypothetical protein IW261DRAFT_1478865 [Armillaria novae-zelandiae]
MVRVLMCVLLLSHNLLLRTLQFELTISVPGVVTAGLVVTMTSVPTIRSTGGSPFSSTGYRTVPRLGQPTEIDL